ncbi:NEDD8-specific protease 1 [Porphyridium purpureum]|uniref:NEDD8-specific protease 1 n=1 Tax=Porphyridium purpureum TaxID=35688 RepID=A0A5J4ZA26_PORPP|nr:NEDD8-specific protease 1 [Porphyridium purpureum]|eukprot:POR7112..scf295_1
MKTSVTVLGDCVLTQHELALCQTPHSWFNDRVIAFSCARDAARARSQGRGADQTAREVRVLDPAVVSLIQLSSEGADELVRDALGACRGAKVSLFPVNDHSDPTSTTEQGSHWSLLVYVSTEGVHRFEHWDSLPGVNHAAAQRLADTLARTLCGNAEYSFQERGDVPRQANTSDCGAYVCLAARYHLLGPSEKEHKRNNLNAWISASAAQALRRELAQSIAKHLEDDASRT